MKTSINDLDKAITLQREINAHLKCIINNIEVRKNEILMRWKRRQAKFLLYKTCQKKTN